VVSEVQHEAEPPIKAGASGYVTKPRLSFDLTLASHEVLNGRTFVSKSIVM
jgi:DNA-binding NarL/FixJ family response regulator